MNKEAIQVAFGDNVKRYRAEVGKSQEDFAETVGVSAAYLGEMERGEKCPSIEIAYRISTALGIGIAQLLDFAGGEHETEEFIKVKSILGRLPDSHKHRLVEIFEKFSELYIDDFKL
jgi:transcriptional regulator with XRE-family HTH domain